MSMENQEMDCITVTSDATFVVENKLALLGEGDHSESVESAPSEPFEDNYVTSTDIGCELKLGSDLGNSERRVDENLVPQEKMNCGDDEIVSTSATPETSPKPMDEAFSNLSLADSSKEENSNPSNTLCSAIKEFLDSNHYFDEKGDSETRGKSIYTDKWKQRDPSEFRDECSTLNKNEKDPPGKDSSSFEPEGDKTTFNAESEDASICEALDEIGRLVSSADVPEQDFTIDKPHPADDGNVSDVRSAGSSIGRYVRGLMIFDYPENTGSGKVFDSTIAPPSQSKNKINNSIQSKTNWNCEANFFMPNYPCTSADFQQYDLSVDYDGQNELIPSETTSLFDTYVPDQNFVEWSTAPEEDENNNICSPVLPVDASGVKWSTYEDFEASDSDNILEVSWEKEASWENVNEESPTEQPRSSTQKSYVRVKYTKDYLLKLANCALAFRFPEGLRRFTQSGELPLKQLEFSAKIPLLRTPVYPAYQPSGSEHLMFYKNVIMASNTRRISSKMSSTKTAL